MRLQGTAITDAGLEQLVGLPGVLVVDAQRTDITRTGVERLTRIARCHVEWNDSFAP
ncbi:MAG TPA: hypothetical protein VGX76_01605 [Pirellulales bacterium]|nr:hypothetical protein [Pirellulales bacterium]